VDFKCVLNELFKALAPANDPCYQKLIPSVCVTRQPMNHKSSLSSWLSLAMMVTLIDCICGINHRTSYVV